MANCKLLLVADTAISHFYTYQAAKIKEKIQTLEAGKVLSLHHDQTKKENTPKSVVGHKLDLQKEAKENDRQEFSVIVAQHLKTLCQEQGYTHLTVIAEPKFLGSLRKNIDKNITDFIKEEISKDLIHADFKELESHLSLL